MRIALELKHCQPTWQVYSRRCRGTRGNKAGEPAGVGSGRGDFPWAVLRHRIFSFTECHCFSVVSLETLPVCFSYLKIVFC